MKSQRVAFTLIGSAAWTGGFNYLVNLLGAIDRHESERVRPVLFCGEDAVDGDLTPFLRMRGVEVVRSTVFGTHHSLARLKSAVLWGVDREALRLFRASHIGVIFEPAKFYGWRFPIPAIAWLPDFQHRHLREHFGTKAYWRREVGFRAQIASGRMIMLSSEDARNDCEQFYPGSLGRTAVVRFAVPVDSALIEQRPESVVGEYRLPAQFFYLPNQFWKHKNHLVVIEALGLLKQQGCEIVVAVTGNPFDPRHPHYLNELKQRVEILGLKQHFRILGMVPRRHVISLMRTCSALINPSFFEGWSSTVEEARALGVPMLLSDIGVHREQMGTGAVYFDPTDAKDLATQLRQISLNSSASIAARHITAQGDENIRRFARDFSEVVGRATGVRRSPLSE